MKSYLYPISLFMVCLAFASSFFMPMDIINQYDSFKIRFLEPEFGFNVFSELAQIEKKFFPYSLTSLALLPNLFFMATVTLMVLKRYIQSFYAGALTVAAMLFWVVPGFMTFGAYSLWLLSGLGLFALQVQLYKRQSCLSFAEILRTWPMYLIYFVVVGNLVFYTYIRLTM